MKITKKLLSLVLAVAVVLSCCVIPMTSQAADGTITFSNPTGAPGETVTITVTAEGVVTGLCCFDIALVPQDKTQGSFTSYTFGTLTKMEDAGTTNCSDEFRACPLDLSMAVDINGECMTIDYTIADTVAPGTVIKIDVEKMMVGDADMNETYPTVNSPILITVAGDDSGSTDTPSYTNPTVVFTGGSAYPGETVTITVDCYNIEVGPCCFDIALVPDKSYGNFTAFAFDSLTKMEDAGTTNCSDEFRACPLDLTGAVDINGRALTIDYTINADVPAGTVIPITVEKMMIGDVNMEEVWPDVIEAKITVLGDVVVEPEKYDITVGTVENGTVTVDKASAEAGETVTVTATPNEGYMLNTILVDGQAISGNTFTVTGAHEVTATFDLIPPSVYTVSVGAVQNGNVEVSANSAEEGTTITVTATPNAHYALDKIYVNGVAINGNTFTLTENAVVTATFTAIQYNITVGDVENGTVTVDKATAVAGATVTVTATAASGFKTAAIFVNGVQITGSTFTVEGDAEVTATFTEVQGILISANKVGYTNQDLVYQGDTDVTIDITVSNNTEKLSAINFIVDLEDGLADLGFGSVTAWDEITLTNIPAGASYTAIVLEDGSLLVNLYYLDAGAGYSDNGVIATLNISTITAASGEFDVVLSEVDASNDTANQVDGETQNGSVLVTAYVVEVTIKDANGNDFVVEVLDTMTTAEKIAEVQAALPNAVITITYNDGTTSEIAYADVTDDLSTVVNDSFTAGTANVTLTYTQSKCPAGKETVTDVYYVNIAIDSAPESITVEGPLYFPYGDQFAWGDTEYTITYESDSVPDQTNVVTSGIGTGTIVADGIENLDNTDTDVQKVTVTINGTEISTTVDVYFVIPTITIESTLRYYEEGATFALSNHSAIITATYSEASGLGTVTVDAADVTVGTASTTLADNVTAEARSVSVTYQGGSDDVEYVVVDLDRVGKVVGRALTITEAELELLDLTGADTAYANNGRGLLTATDFVQVRNISIRK
ncbi:MAG: hypothetical protein J6A50_06730 [Clostridia bacterium]|nr:hypothetical protein [Clostridia bacterium]